MGKLTIEDAVMMIKRLVVVISKLSPGHSIIGKAKSLIADEPNDLLRGSNMEGVYVLPSSLGYRLAKQVDGQEYTYCDGQWCIGEAQMFDEPKKPVVKSDIIDVYDWLDDVFGLQLTEDEVGARMFLELMLLPAVKYYAYKPMLDRMLVLCAYKGEVYRCTGASTMGSIYLSNPDVVEVCGYDICVLPEECSDWRFKWLDTLPTTESDEPIGNVMWFDGGKDGEN